MKKTLPIILILQSILFAKLNTVVSILPEKTFVKAIGGEKVKVSLMVLPGNSPHTYEPKPSQMKEIAEAQLYFAIGVEFEKVWLPKFKDLNSKMQVIDLSKGITKLPMAEHHEHGGKAVHEGIDPHIWTSPKNVAKIAQHIYAALSTYDPKNTAYYKNRLETFLAEIRETDEKIKKILSEKKGAVFMVFHPSWGYFAHDYELTQLPVEVEGKEPKPKELIQLIKKAQEHHVSAIFTQPEFSDHAAKVIANELHIPVIKVSPLASDWSNNLLRIAKAIAGAE